VSGGRERGERLFISFTAVNEPWAMWIAVTREGTGYTPLVQGFDVRPGQDFVHKMQEATSGTNRTIAVLSPAYSARHGRSP
jgi:hypothetical protein